MISLPPGVTINHHVKLIINELTIEIFEWFRNLGAQVWVEDWYDSRGRKHEQPYIRIGQGKASYRLQDGSGNVILDFRSEDAGVALMFLMKFDQYVVSHNMKDLEEYHA